MRRALPQLNINAVDQQKASTTGLWGELADTTKRAGGVTKTLRQRQNRANRRSSKNKTRIRHSYQQQFLFDSQND